MTYENGISWACDDVYGHVMMCTGRNDVAEAKEIHGGEMKRWKQYPTTA